MDNKEIGYLFDKKKKKGKDTLLQKFHVEKESKVFDSKKEDSLLMVQKF